MKLVDVSSRKTKEAESIHRKVLAFVKKAGCNVGEVLFNEVGNVYFIQVENDGRLGDDIADIVRKSPTAKLHSVTEHKGDYMWDADKYIRPASVVTFAF